jgi:hypothetical protein
MDSHCGMPWLRITNQEQLDLYLNLHDMIKELKFLNKKYGNEYESLHFLPENNCGCRYQCTCHPSYVLWGTRLETDLEYDYRLKVEKRQQDDRDARDKAAFERLKKQFGE